MDRSYSIGFEYIDDTAAHTGRFWQLYALADAVIASAVIENQTGNTFTSVPLKAGDLSLVSLPASHWPAVRLLLIRCNHWRYPARYARLPVR
jgi:hypothetical protein